MEDTDNLEFYNLIDRSVKALFRECPAAILRLAGLSVEPSAIRIEDPNLNLPELRADHVFIVSDEKTGQEKAIYLEYQLKPDGSLLPSWCAKWGGLTRQLKMPVALLALYLQKGDYATFHDNYRIQIGGLETRLQFNAICLWEQTERIKNGEMPELAPLLLLYEENPTEQTLRDEVALIQGSNLSEKTQKELESIALLVATRQFAREILESIFKEVLSDMEGITIVEDWIRKGMEKGEAIGIEKGMEKGRAEGEAIGATRNAREMTLHFLSRRFGDLPDTLVKQIEMADAEWCRNLFDRAASVETLAELNLNAPE